MLTEQWRHLRDCRISLSWTIDGTGMLETLTGEEPLMVLNFSVASSIFNRSKPKRVAAKKFLYKMPDKCRDRVGNRPSDFLVSYWLNTVPTLFRGFFVFMHPMRTSADTARNAPNVAHKISNTI
jgi:hypothetical protein